MKLKELDQLNKDPEFTRFRRRLDFPILLWITLGGIVIILIWSGFDRFYEIRCPECLLWLRVSTIGILGLNLLAAHLFRRKESVKRHLIAGFYFGNTFCMLLSMFTGASQSPYWYGFFFIIIAWFVVFPLKYRELIIHGAIFVLMYLTGIIAQKDYPVLPHEIAKMIFLYGITFMVGSFSAYMKNLLDAENFVAKAELDKTNNNLLKFRTVLDQAPGAVMIMDKEFRLEYLNPHFTRISGYTEQELLSRTIQETLYGDKIPESRKKLTETIMQGQPWQGELLTRNKDGSMYWANTIASPYQDSAGNVAGYIVIQQDITEKKEMALALEEKENLYRSLIEKSLDGIVISQNGKLVLANKAFADMIGYTEQECIDSFGPDSLAPEDRERVLDIHYKRMKGELGDLRYSASILCKDGSKVTAEFNTTTIDYHGTPASLISTRNITQQIRMQEALERSMKKYREFTEMLPQTVYELDTEGRQIYINKAGLEAFGFDQPQPGKPVIDSIAPEDRDRLMSNMQKNLETGKPFWYNEYMAIRTDGTRFPIIIYAAPVYEEGKLIGSRGLVIDISERKEMETALRESEMKYKTLVENSQDGIMIVRNNRILFANDTFCRMLKQDCTELYSRPSVDFIHPDDRSKALDISLRRQSGESSTITENLRLLVNDGQTIECETYSTVIDYQGKMASFFTIHDVTEKKRMQEALARSEMKYRELTEMLPQAVYELDAVGNPTYMNKAGRLAFRIEKAEKGQKAFDFFSPEDMQKMKAALERESKNIRYENGKLIPFGSEPMEFTARRSDGTTFPVIIYGTPIIENEQVVGSRGIIVDISDRKTMEQALMDSEEKYRTLIEKAVDGIIITQNGYLKFVNRAFCEMMKYDENEMIDQPYLDFVVPEDHEMMKSYHSRRMKGEEFQTMYRSTIIKKDGSKLHVELSARTSEYNHGPAAFIIVRDITERLKTEEELLKAKTQLEQLNQNLEVRVQESTHKLTEVNTQLIRLQKENLQSQFEVLRQQVNPHFLFNSLNVLTSLIKIEPDLAEKFTEHLSKVYRYVLENKDNDLVSLRTELDFLDAYLFLLNIRFMGKISVDIRVEEDLKEYLVLPLALQLIIENAIKHNTMSKKAPLVIRIFVDEKLHLNIINNLQERESQMISTGVGLKNIAHRYELLELPAPEFYKTPDSFVARIPLKSNE